MVSLREQLSAFIPNPAKVQAFLEAYWGEVSHNPTQSFRMGCFIHNVKHYRYDCDLWLQQVKKG